MTWEVHQYPSAMLTSIRPIFGSPVNSTQNLLADLSVLPHTLPNFLIPSSLLSPFRNQLLPNLQQHSPHKFTYLLNRPQSPQSPNPAKPEEYLRTPIPVETPRIERYYGFGQRNEPNL